MNNWLEMTRLGGNVTRNHTYPTLLNHTVGHHSFNMCCIVLEATQGQASAELMKACLFHDIHEQFAGDVPAPAKWANKDLHALLYDIQDEFDAEWGLVCELTDKETALLHFADNLEFMQYCLDERNLGNVGITPVFERSRNSMTRRGYPNMVAEAMVMVTVSNWEKHFGSE